jgi:hypothetical protein
MFGVGALKITKELATDYIGITEKTVQRILNTMPTHTAQRPIFKNKSTLKPVKATTVNSKHQIDLVKMPISTVVNITMS